MSMRLHHRTPDHAPVFTGYFAASVHCPHCDEPMIASVLSEFVDGEEIRHHWLCDACAYAFSTEVGLLPRLDLPAE
jgi:hypothetical protein